ncbi:Crp/Fnr family transcriptional regulator [Mycobacterium marseillense]|uniref:Crp/Fnr family transcriptional regulator n=1 Tax=Mycobacterium marseillense TaxID=701042 RepID=UPI0010423BE6|nr:Crp/Fnr family transcriptional regulator [Mycobacterium marseillense]MCA2264600.1 Crp/Fnr family transcriptional regulator [Mycobacterium marseillense]
MQTAYADMKIFGRPGRSHEAGRHEGLQSADVTRALLASGIFSKTDPRAVSVWANQMAPVHLPPGHVMVEDGNFGGCLHVIICGKVKVCHRRTRGCEIVLNILGPSDMLGVITLFSAGSEYVTATTLTEVTAVPIERDQFCGWMAEHPEVACQMLRLMARWTKTMTDCLVDFVSEDAQVRLASRLLALRKRFGLQDGDAVRVVHNLTPGDLSLLVGIAPETIGETLHDFEERGWIRLEDDSVVIVDAQALMSVRPLGVSEVCGV